MTSFLFQRDRERDREMGKNLIYSFDYRSISAYGSLFSSSMYPYWSDIIPLSLDTRLNRMIKNWKIAIHFII